MSEQEYLKYSKPKRSDAEPSDNLSDLELELVLADGTTYPEPGRFYFADRQVDPKTGAIRMAGVFPNRGQCLTTRTVWARACSYKTRAGCIAGSSACGYRVTGNLSSSSGWQ